MYAYEFKGRRYDVGDKLGFLEATVDFALKKPELKDSFMDYLKKVCKETNIEKEVALTEDSESKDKKVIKQREVIELAKSKQAKMNKIIAIGIAAILLITSITTLISVISWYL